MFELAEAPSYERRRGVALVGGSDHYWPRLNSDEPKRQPSDPESDSRDQGEPVSHMSPEWQPSWQPRPSTLADVDRRQSSIPAGQRPPATSIDTPSRTTDQKVGGSNPFERAKGL